MKSPRKWNISLFQTPGISINRLRVGFPLKKAEALFYFLVVKRHATRDELAALLWEDSDDLKAGKNLRHALYLIRKSLGNEILGTSSNREVHFLPPAGCRIDIDVFLNSSGRWIEAYSGEFLQGFYVKNAPRYMEWMRDQAERFREIYISRLHRLLNEQKTGRSALNRSQIARLLIETDEFDERAYRVLMRSEMEKGDFLRAIELYRKLSEILDRELGIAPDFKTRQLFREILANRKEGDSKSPAGGKPFFYGREEELNSLMDGYDRFFSGRENPLVLIEGEPGVGKTRLKEAFLEQIHGKDILCFETACYQAEEKYPLKPWNNIFAGIGKVAGEKNIEIPSFWKNVLFLLFPGFSPSLPDPSSNPLDKLDTLKPKIIEDAVLFLLDHVARNQRIMLIFEDLQWIDDMSLTLLQHVLLHDQSRRISVTGTLRSGYFPRMDKLITILTRYNRLRRIPLRKFNRKEVDDFAASALPGHLIPEELKAKLYRETEGNAFFLVEFLNRIKEKGDVDVMTVRMQDILKSRVIDVSDPGKKLLKILSLFFYEVPMELIAELSGKDDNQILEVMEELKSKYLVRESGDAGRTGYTFTHIKLREFIYSRLSPIEKKILQNKIGRLLERELNHDYRDILIYPRLVYHFSQGGNYMSALRFCLRNAAAYLDFSHELFPELSRPVAGSGAYLQVTREIAWKYLEDIKTLLNKAKRNASDPAELNTLEAEFCHMWGRFYIREGEYRKGIGMIRNVISSALKCNNPILALKGHRQLIFYAVQTFNLPLMEENVEAALELAREAGLDAEIGVLYRLKGLNRIMSGRFDEAVSLLEESVRVFSLKDMGERYSLCIAAALNYLGDIERNKMDFSRAREFYQRAIAIAKPMRVTSSLALFHTNAGQTAYEMGDFASARGHIRNAVNLYERFDTVWGRSTAIGFSALLKLQAGQFPSALRDLKKADEYARQLQSPYELGVLSRIKAEIRLEMDNNRLLSEKFAEYLDLDTADYCRQGMKLLRKTHNRVEIKRLTELRNRFRRF